MTERISTRNLDRYGARSCPGASGARGRRHQVTCGSTLERLAGVYRAGGWPTSVEGDALTAPYSASSAGPPRWHLYRLALHTAVGVAGAEPQGATRWDFAH
jgi:hypothetical protein